MSREEKKAPTLTNEQLVGQIKNGMHWLLPVLWERVERLLTKAAFTFYKQREERCIKAGVSVEDLQQQTYLAMVQAVDAYREGEYLFTTFLNYHLLNQFNTAIGVRTQKGKYDPLTNSISLDAPVGTEDDTFTLADTVSDGAAQDDFLLVEDEDLRRDFWQTVEDNLPNQEEADCIREYYRENKTVQKIAAERNTEPKKVQAAIKRGQHHLRGYKIRKQLEGYRGLIENVARYSGGLSTFRHTWTSSVEKAVLIMERQENGE